MRIYTGIKEAYGEIQRDLVEMGTEVHPESMQDLDIRGKEEFLTKELQGYTYCITSDQKAEEEFAALGGNVFYADQEFLDRISEGYRNPGRAWVHRKEVWEPFIHDDKMAYTYNERFREQLPIILEELRKRPNTRQAVMTMWDRHQDIANLGGKARVPCSLSYQFLIRKSMKAVPTVDLIYTMRSCDVYTHMLYDIWITMKIQRYVADYLGLEFGRFIHFIGSLHAYKKDYEPKKVF